MKQSCLREENTDYSHTGSQFIIALTAYFLLCLFKVIALYLLQYLQNILITRI